jgi:predicted nucleic acid-binding protein
LIVVDASALIDLLLESEARNRLEQRLLSGEESLHAPHMVDLEVTHTLRRLVLTRVLPSVRAEVALTDMANLRIDRYPHVELVPRIWELRDTLTAYDGAYVALAEALEAPLVTRDARLARSSGHRARIEMI